MTPKDLIDRSTVLGVALTVTSSGHLRIANLPHGRAGDEFLEQVRGQKRQVIELLMIGGVPASNPGEDWIRRDPLIVLLVDGGVALEGAFEVAERAAIREIDGGIDRGRAEVGASMACGYPCRDARIPRN
jgi:hypothetical protein